MSSQLTPIGGQVSHRAESIIVLNDLRDLYTIIQVVCVSVIRGSWGQVIKTWDSLFVRTWLSKSNIQR